MLFYKNELIGSFGKLSKSIFKTLKVDKADMFAFDIFIEKLNFSKSVVKFESINALPKIARRINLVMNQSDSIKPVLNLIKDEAGEDLIDYYPVEIFEDVESLGENKKSVVFEMVFQHKEKTLEDKDVNPIIDEIIDIAQKNFNAKLRV
jgi:phenylalanyl-tRNA synthetase beta chain